MLAAWSSEGVDVSAVVRFPRRVPGLYLIRTDAKGERHFTYWRDSAPVRQLFDEGGAEAAEAALAAASVIYLSGITLSLFSSAARGRLFGSLARLRQGGRRIVFDSNFRPRGWPDISDAREAYDQMLRMTDVVLAGEDDFKLLATGASLIEFLSRYELPEAVVKLMEPGCVVLAEGGRTDVPVAAVVQPLDTTAAGDSFAAAYLAARLRGMLPAKAAIAVHALAGAVILHSGAILPQDAMPTGLFGAPSNLDQS